MSYQVQVLPENKYYRELVSSSLQAADYSYHISNGDGDVVVFSGSGKPCRDEIARAEQSLNQSKSKELYRRKLQIKLAQRKAVPKIENK